MTENVFILQHFLHPKQRPFTEFQHNKLNKTNLRKDVRLPIFQQ